MKTIKKLESEVRGYSRSFPTTFKKAQGSILINQDGTEYIDFFAGAGALNYGHNHPEMKQKLVDYLAKDGVVHGLDMATEAKVAFMEAFDNYILKPRDLRYKMQFTGPTGTNTVEAAIKLAQIVTGRSQIISFTNAYHGHTKGALRVTANAAYKKGLEDDVHQNTTFIPFDGYMKDGFDSADYLDKIVSDDGSGATLPAAIILECVQGEGGINVASPAWLKKIEQVANKHGIILIVDEIQAGCGRTGDFFSFEFAGIKPDMITLSKSISGFGMPMSLLLFKEELDQWDAGQHTGTFRGNNLGFVTATKAIELFWKDDSLSKGVKERHDVVFDFFDKLKADLPDAFYSVRGRGLMIGIEFRDKDFADKVTTKAFENGLIIETCGAEDHVMKILVSLNVPMDILDKGLKIIEKSISEVMEEEKQHA